MKVEVWVATYKVGSKCSDTIEIPEEELEGMDEKQRAQHIEDSARDAIWNMADWGWREVE
jgi:hypothetical protein